MFTGASPDRDVDVAESGMITYGRPKAELVLTHNERERLTSLTARRKSAQALAQRARIMLRCADGLTNTVVAEEDRITA